LATIKLRILESIADVPEADWDALVLHDPQANPFVRWAFLEAMEHSGCATARTGWKARHLTIWDGKQLVAAAPAYARADSDGDFSRDWHWAEFAQRAGFRYYPKLLVTVPFTPVSGRRFLVASGLERAPYVSALVTAARELAKEERYSSVHVLFAAEDEMPELTSAGLAQRQSYQFHWHNRGYTSYDDFLARALDSKRRHQARRERAAAATQGIALRTVRGEELASDAARWGKIAHDFHRSTVDKLMWGRPWLNLAFYQRIFTRMPGPLEVVAAERDGHFVAGAFNVASATRLFGRYWGCHEDHPFLHFHVCLYHSVDDCIARGLQVFEGGAGGEHKMSRGFEPTETYSAHAFTDPRLDRAIREHLVRESAERAAELEAWRAQHPIRVAKR
jgi:predicted N-acyltransferase